MAPTLYYNPASPPCHLVLLTAKALNLDLTLKNVDLMKEEHLTQEYKKLNPQHTVPTLVDGDLVLWESRAISRYLVNQYGAGNKLYPQEPRARALVDQRLDFDFGTLYHRYAEYFYPQFYDKTKKPEESKLKKLEEALGYLNNFLEGSEYVAGSDLTIADLALLASIATMETSGIDLKGFPNIVRWFALMKTTAPGYQDAVQKHLDTYEALMEEWKKNAS